MKGFINTKIYVRNKGVIKTNIGFDNGRISYIGDNSDNIEPLITLNDDDIIVPGFIDEHIHGISEYEAMKGSYEDIAGMSNELLKSGVTGFLPTTDTQTPDNIIRTLKSAKKYMDENNKNGAEVLGIHLEGPFISQKYIGAQPDCIKEHSIDLFRQLQNESGNIIKIVTLAPEKKGSKAFIEYLINNKIVVSIGHTDAKYEDIDKAIDSGATCVTHIYNAQRPLHHREIGTVGAALLRDELSCEVICDTVHVSVPALQLLYKVKPFDKIIIITDSESVKTVDGKNIDAAGRIVIAKDGVCRMEDGTLSGSLLRTNEAVRNLVTKVGVKFSDAVDFASINPAINLKIDKDYGSIEKNKKANLAILNNGFDVLYTLIEGKVVYKR